MLAVNFMRKLLTICYSLRLPHHLRCSHGPHPMIRYSVPSDPGASRGVSKQAFRLVGDARIMPGCRKDVDRKGASRLCLNIVPLRPYKKLVTIRERLQITSFIRKISSGAYSVPSGVKGPGGLVLAYNLGSFSPVSSITRSDIGKAKLALT